MKIELTRPWRLTVVPHRVQRALVGGGQGLPSFSELPPLGVPCTPEGVVTVPATVPGNFELDLYRAGVIPNPFFGTNITDLRDLEDRHLYYVTSFDAPAGQEAVTLHFEGVDTVAEVYVNGRPVGKCDNMFIPWDFPLTDLKPADNQLVVHILPAMLVAQDKPVPPAAGAFDHSYASLGLRKAPSSFGWDILCRAVSGGIWREVRLETAKPAPALEQVYLYTFAVDPRSDGESVGDAMLDLYYSFRTDGELTVGYEVEVEGHCGESSFVVRREVWHTCGNYQIPVPNAKLWYPKNAGEQNLYEVRVTLYRHGVPADVRDFRIGIRMVELDRTSCIDENGQGEFRFLINHRPVFLMGSNWVPLDAFHSRDAERLPEALRLLDEAGCNAVRCWGGNVYEDTAFFDFCDEKGILVWQDFAMGCALYPVWDEELQENLRREVLSVVRKLRMHPSLCLWAGDNECDLFWMMCYPFRRDPSGNILTRRIIPEVLQAEDFTRPYLPSSPYIDETAYARGGQRTSEDHLWGPRDYFKGDFYRTAPCHFASETGYHGCPDPDTLREYIPEDQLWPIFDQGTAEEPFKGTPHPAWLAHQTSMELNEHNTFGYRISLMTSQVRHMFRDLPDGIDCYARMSQLSQAEAFKYFIERFRVAKWDKTGIIWWNLLDGWPQVSDAVVNYNLRPKLAYSFIQRAQTPVLLAFADPTDGTPVRALHAVNDSRSAVTLRYEVRDAQGVDGLTDAPLLLAGEVTVPSDGNITAASLDFAGREDHVLSIKWQEVGGDLTGASHYIAEPQQLDYAAYTRALRVCGMVE